jgi:hypothetical protein
VTCDVYREFVQHHAISVAKSVTKALEPSMDIDSNACQTVKLSTKRFEFVALQAVLKREQHAE